MLRFVKRGTHSIAKAFRSRKILIVDGDQSKVGNGQRDELLTKYGEVHVFRNEVSTEIQQRQDIDATFCKYHEAPVTIKEAVDHNITFFCGQYCSQWKRDNVSVTIVSKDRVFMNTKALLEANGVTCTILPTIYNKFNNRQLIKRT